MSNIYVSNDAFLRDYNKLNQENKIKAGRFIKNLLTIQRAENKLEQKISVLTGESRRSSSGSNIRCDFCGKQADDVSRMIAGNEVYICNECVDFCSIILKEQNISYKEAEHIETTKA